jgi:hypothetical protein
MGRPRRDPRSRQLFGVLLALHTFYLTALHFDFALLLLQLALGLVVLNFLVLHFVADRIAADAANATTDQRARSRMADSRADYRSGAGAKQGTTARPHLTICQRLSRTSTKKKHRRERNTGGRNPTFAHKKYLPLNPYHSPQPASLECI